MLRQQIILNNYIYIAEHYDANTDLKNNMYYQEYVMLRNYELINNVIVDKDIYFIEKDVYYNVCEQMKLEKTKYTDIITFPIPNTKISGYTNFYENFNALYNDSSFINKESIGTDVYELYDNNGKSIEILCDIIKLYHPISKPELNGVVHVYNIINGITFHYICKNYDKFKSKTDTEIIIDNEQYSEYIEIHIPNLRFLFNEDNVYFKDDLNLSISEKNAEFLNTKFSKTNDHLCAFNILIQPFKIIEEHTRNNETIHVKQYLKLRKSIENNYLNYPINLVLYPFSYLEESTKLYIIDDILNTSEITLFKKCNFNLNSNLGFDNGKLCLLNTFTYPDIRNIESPKDAYKYFYNVTENEYITYKIELEDKIKSYIEEHYDIKIDSDLTEYYNNYKEEIEDELETSIDFLGFKFSMASDINFKNIITERYINIDFNKLDNYNIRINDIFKSWNEMPEQVICLVQFIDRYLGILITSNTVVITKEWFKYIINEEGIFNVPCLNKLNNDMKEIKLDNTHVNFINNITCIVNKNDKKQDVINKNNNLKVLYKPYFFRTQELQNIKLRNSYVQNIGINLSEYMTKVETFKIVINGNEYIEKGRNDIYVIFSINAKELNNDYGKYDIINQDDEYISTGNYTIY